MATITKKVDRNIQGTKRYQYWVSTENNDDGTVIAVGDIFKLEDSLGRPARYVLITTSVGCDLEIRFNTQVTHYQPRDSRLNWPNPGPDLENPITVTDVSQDPVPVSANSYFELDNVIAVSDIQIATFGYGSFEIFVS